jgi:hypothetical protein
MGREPCGIGGLASRGGCAGSGSFTTVSSEDYAPPYDYNQFRLAADGRDFPVRIDGQPFANPGSQETSQRLLVLMQANKPRPRLRFTLDDATSGHRLVLVFNPSNTGSAANVCKGNVTFGRPMAGRMNVFAVYCRGELPLSQAIGRAAVSGPDDPTVGQLFSYLFQTVFTDEPVVQPDRGYPGGLI